MVENKKDYLLTGAHGLDAEYIDGLIRQSGLLEAYLEDCDPEKIPTVQVNRISEHKYVLQIEADFGVEIRIEAHAVPIGTDPEKHWARSDVAYQPKTIH